MSELFKYLCIHGEPSPTPEFSLQVAQWEKLTWGVSAHVRWVNQALHEFQPAAADAALIVFEWSTGSEDSALKIKEVLLGKTPILVVYDTDARLPQRERFLAAGGNRAGRSSGTLANLSDLQEVLAEVGVPFPKPQKVLYVDPGDRFCNQLIRQLSAMGTESDLLADAAARLNLIIQKYFPFSGATAQVFPVAGGWSGVPLLRLSIGGSSEDYFLKFFQDEAKFEEEIAGHQAAKRWLQGQTVDIVRVPGMPGNVTRCIKRAFPTYRNVGSLHFPVCYQSAASGGARATLKGMYVKERDDGKLGEAYRRLLDILGNQRSLRVESRSPRLDSAKDGFFEDLVRLGIAASVLDDLKQYWRGFLKDSEERALYDSVHRVLVGELPGWLRNNASVSVGHIHGDPNSRNCLVNASNPADLVLIDCGAYRDDGYLVFDLSQIEADLKLVLMASEEDGFGDLDARRLKDWAEVEKACLEPGLDLDTTSAEAILNGIDARRSRSQGQLPPSVRRAYGLIAMVRERAKALSPNDTKGVHYFACLLFWSLRWLKLPAVRSTKKLLALFSAGEILRKFEA